MGFRLVAAGLMAGLFVGSVPASAQTNFQLWGNFYLTWLTSHRASFGLETEPKALLAAPAGTAGWWELDLTPSAQYIVTGWLDVTGEFMAGGTKQTDGLRTLELTPRAGMRLHLFSRDLPSIRQRGPAGRELPPRRRIVIRDYLRLESRNIFYDSGAPSSSTWRMRNRLDAQFPLNRDRVTADGAIAAVADWEFFVPLDDPAERFANRQRIRLGLGYRHSRDWRLTVLYVGTRTRDTLGEPFSVSSRAVSLTVVRTFQ